MCNREFQSLVCVLLPKHSTVTLHLDKFLIILLILNESLLQLELFSVNISHFLSDTKLKIYCNGFGLLTIVFHGFIFSLHF